MLFSVPSACGPGSEKIKISVGFRYGASEQERQYYSECKAEFERRYPRYELVSSPYVYDSRTIVSKYASGQLPVLFEADAAEAGRSADFLGFGEERFLFAFAVFEELGLLEIRDGRVRIIRGKKTQLDRSKIYSAVCRLAAE